MMTTILFLCGAILFVQVAIFFSLMRLARAEMLAAVVVQLKGRK